MTVYRKYFWFACDVA